MENNCPLCDGCVILELTGKWNCFGAPYYAIYSEVVMGDRKLYSEVREQDRNKLIPLRSLVTEMLGILRSL